MAIGVFVVVTIRQIAMLLTKAFTTGVVFAGLTIKLYNIVTMAVDKAEKLLPVALELDLADA